MITYCRCSHYRSGCRAYVKYTNVYATYGAEHTCQNSPGNIHTNLCNSIIVIYKYN